MQFEEVGPGAKGNAHATSQLPPGGGIRDLVSAFFQGIIFFKKEDINDSSIYIAKISSAFNNSFLTLVCPTKVDEKVYIDSPGVCLESVQARVLPNFGMVRIAPQTWKISRDISEVGYNTPIYLVSKTREYSTYAVRDRSVEVMVYHNPKKKDLSGKTSITQYPEQFSLLGALETWGCVIQFKDNFCRFEKV
jgi:hypothetical protein